MKHDRDIQQMMAGIRTKRRFRNVNHDKLARLLERCELDVPVTWMGEAANLQQLHEQASSEAPRKRLSIGSIPKPARWAAAPVCAAAAIMIIFFMYPFVFKDNNRTGTARNISGDVRIIRDGSEQALGAGDSVVSNDIIISGRASSADIRFKNSLQMRVLGGSRVFLRNVVMKDRGRAFDALVTSGGCIIQVGKLDRGESVSVHTPSSVAVVHGTVFGVRIDEKGSVRYEVFEGKVRVRRCVPADAVIKPASAEILNRYFEEHAVEISGRQACVIGPDARPLDAVSDGNVLSAIASISLPGLLPDAGDMLQMRNDAEQLIRTADVRNEKKIAAGESGNDQKLRAPGSGISHPDTVYLTYIPELDFVLAVGDKIISAIRFEETRWSVTLDGSIASLPIYEGTSLFVPTIGGMITKIDLYTGAKQWTTHVNGKMNKNTRLALDVSGLYCTTDQGVLYKFNRNGDVLWYNSIGGIISATPVITDRLIFIPTSGGSLFGIDTSNGVKIIKVKIGSTIRTIGSHKEHIYIVTDTGRIYCYNYKKDEMLWNLSINDAIMGEIVIENNSVYLFGGKGRIYRISTAGALIWNRDIGSPILKKPSDDASSFYIPASETLYVIDKITGNVTWSLLVPRITSGNVAVSRGYIYFGIDKNGLASLKK
jgi:outer membrane protein assembly factor BamB